VRIDLNTADSDWFKPRLNRVVYLVIIAFLALFARLFYLQVLEGDALRRQSASNSIRLQHIDPPRGLIFDRHKRLLADNRPAFHLQVIPKDARPLEKSLKKMAIYLDADPAALAAQVKSAKGVPSYKPIVLLSDINRNRLAAFEAHKYDMPGASVSVKSQRQYLNATEMAHIIGYLSEINARELKQSKYGRYRGGDQIGKFGAEKAFEGFLKGKRGGRQVEVNATGQVVSVLKTVDAQPGRSVYLTIDLVLQQRAHKLMAGRAGAAVAMDPQNGEILALVSSPSYDPNAFVSGMSSKTWAKLLNNPLHPLVNKAIKGEYPPASTYKIITAAAGLEEGVVNEKTEFYCPGYLELGDRTFRCWNKRGHGNMNVVRAIAESCDVYFYHVGQLLGVDRLAWYAKSFGLGAVPGLNLGRESKGLVASAGWKKRKIGRSWQKGETLTVAIGQGYNLVTPLHMAVVIGAMANGGKRLRPLILKEVQTSSGEIFFKSKTEILGQLPISKATFALVKQGLYEAVNTAGGTAWGVRSQHLSVSGKTGTAQVVTRDQDEDDSKKKKKKKRYGLRDHAWFVGFGPSEKPKIAVAVIIEHGEHGSTTAAPIVMELIETYLGIETEMKKDD
jgi:penicillin-binding protein 2